MDIIDTKIHRHTNNPTGFTTRVAGTDNSSGLIKVTAEAAVPPSVLLYKKTGHDTKRCITCGGPSCSTGVAKTQRDVTVTVGCPFPHDIPDIQRILSEAQDVANTAITVLKQLDMDAYEKIAAIDNNTDDPDLAETRAKIPDMVFDAVSEKAPQLAEKWRTSYGDLMRKAWDLSEEKGPMHDLFSRLCSDALCKTSCIPGRAGHGSVEIPTNMAFMSDYAYAHGWLNEPIEKRGDIDENLLIVGSGFAGMCAAHEAIRQGYKDIVVVEANAKIFEPGGRNILQYKIPHKRFDAHTERLRKSGVQFHTNRPVGGDSGTPLLDLASEFDAKTVIVATGATKPRTMELKGNVADKIKTWADVTEEQQAVDADNLDGELKHNLTGKTVAVIGTGDVAVDVLHTAAAQGAKEVIFISRHDRLAVNDDAAFKKAKATEEAKGVQFTFQTFMSPDHFEGLDNGTRVLKGADNTEGGDRVELKVDEVVFAINSGTGDLKAIFGEAMPTGERGERFIPEEFVSEAIAGASYDPNNHGAGRLGHFNGVSVYVAGDNVRGPTLAAKAGADGQNAVRLAVQNLG